MKVTFVDEASYKLGGVERVVNTLANHLVNRYDIEVCSLYRHNRVPFYKYDNRVNISYLIDLSDVKSTNSKTKLGFYVYRIFEKIFEACIYKKRIKYLINSVLMKTDVVIFSRITVAVLFLPYMKAYKGKIIVRDASHLYDTSILKKRCMKKYFPELVNTFIVSSEESRRLYIDFFGLGKMNIKKIYNPLGITPKTDDLMHYKRIIGVGRYDYQKGFDNLILAYAKVYKKHPDWKLALIGMGAEYRHYVSLCKKLGIIDHVELKKSTDIVKEYSKSGIFVMTSRWEGYANALVEAMACGVPAISYDWFVGVDDIIQDGNNGLIVYLQDRAQYFRGRSINVRDVDNLADSINNLIEDGGLRKKLSLNAIDINSSRNVTNIVQEWINIIEEE